MATVSIEVNDDLLTRFYESIGAQGEADWTSEELELWRNVAILTPLLNDCLLHEVTRATHVRTHSIYIKQWAAKEEADLAVTDAETARRKAAFESLPEKLQKKPDRRG